MLNDVIIETDSSVAVDELNKGHNLLTSCKFMYVRWKANALVRNLAKWNKKNERYS